MRLVLNRDIETFYRINAHALQLTADFGGSKWIIHLIKSCRLKPYSVFRPNYNRRRLERKWVDEFGGSVYFYHTKLETLIKDPKIKGTEVSTDLFGARCLKDTMAMSSAVVVSENIFLLYGQDEYFRAFTPDGARVSPLAAEAGNILRFLPELRTREKYFEDGWAIYALPNKEIETLMLKEADKKR